MVCFVPIVCLSIRKSCQRRDCSELGAVRNWVDHCSDIILLLANVIISILKIIKKSALKLKVV